MAAARRAGRLARQSDFVEWFSANSAPLRAVTAERWRLEKGVLDYLRDGAAFIRDMRSAKKEDPKESVTDEKVKKEPSAVDQYYASQDLLKRMKWKRVTWDADADFEGFSRRVMDNDTVFSKVPAFSHMSIHLVRDLAARDTSGLKMDDRRVTAIKPGSLTKWFLEERVPGSPDARPSFVAPPKTRQAPFTVDWEAGTVRMLDSASLQELLVYLSTVAPRVQAVQQRMEEEQTKISEDIDNVRVRLGATAIKFNHHDRAFWDDPERAKNVDEYVTPADVRQFIDSVNLRSLHLRKYVKNNQVRIVSPGRPYAIDMEAKEIRIPANFAEYNYLPVHGRYESMEAVCNFFRKSALAWFFVGMMVVGDFELL